MHFRAANLREATLVEADLRGADLRGSDLAGAVIGSTILGRIDLSETKGLESVTHVGPSFIDLDTLFASLGRVPEAFVRGCGVQEYLISHLPSLLDTARAINCSSCFISYGDADESFARRLHDAWSTAAFGAG